MKLSEKIAALAELHDYMISDSAELAAARSLAKAKNGWFDEQSTTQALHGMASYLTKDALARVAEHYALHNQEGGKRVGLVLAGNIPMVGWHDVLCTFLCDHISLVKYSEKDSVLIPHLLDRLATTHPESKAYFERVNRLEGYDVVIATGSNNSAHYFESYFGHVPHIIRKNRHSLAILTGAETKADILDLGRDVYTYYGLGCRNVSHVMVPEDYDFSFLLETLHDGYKEVVMHHKYKNNFDFNFATMSMNKVPFLMNGSLLITESEALASPVAVLNYSRYQDEEQLRARLEQWGDQVQCVVAADGLNLEAWPQVAFGQAQCPGIMDFADGVDTIQFLLQL